MNDAPTPNRTTIRLGLAMVALAFVVAVVLAFVVDGAFVKAIMFAIALTAFVRAYLLSRSLRRPAS